MRRDPFQAIADPTRRVILGMIASEPLTINAVAGNFGVSRTAVYKHMKILTECGLIVVKQKGRERYCRAKMESLHEVSAWIEQYREHWEGRMNMLEQLLKEKRTVKKTRPVSARSTSQRKTEAKHVS